MDVDDEAGSDDNIFDIIGREDEDGYGQADNDIMDLMDPDSPYYIEERISPALNDANQILEHLPDGEDDEDGMHVLDVEELGHPSSEPEGDVENDSIAWDGDDLEDLDDEDYLVEAEFSSESSEDANEIPGGPVVRYRHVDNAFFGRIGEVFDVPEDDHGNGENVLGEIHFDRSLPAEHSYLGENMDRVCGVEYLETGREHRLLLYSHRHIVYPGEVFPFMISHSVIDGDIDVNNGLLFGLVFPYVRSSTSDAMYGVTCQIYEMSSNENGRTHFKSRALQRFLASTQVKRENLENIAERPQRKSYGDVVILPEIYLPDPLSSINMGCMNRWKEVPGVDSIVRDFQAATTVWPRSVYEEYNVYSAVQKVLKSLEIHKVDSIPTDPIRLSYWLSRNSHFSEDQLKKIFAIDSVNLRLKAIVDLFSDGGLFVCRICGNQIAYCSDLFAMSKNGVQSQFCNASGYIHEINTVYKVIKKSILLTGPPSKEFSWFPGYMWQIIVCRVCNRHIGWRFTTQDTSLVPDTFFGITGGGLRIEKSNALRVSDRLLMELGRLVNM